MGKKISQLNEDNGPSLTDQVATYDAESGGTKRVTIDSLKGIVLGTEWWEEIGRTTLGSTGDTITVSSLTAKKYLKIIIAAGASGGTLDTNLTFNNDTSTAYRMSYHVSSAPGTSTDTSSTTSLPIESTTVQDAMMSHSIAEIANITGLSTYLLGTIKTNSISSSASAQTWLEGHFRYVHGGNQITRVDVNNAGSGSFAIGSEVIVLGHD